MAEPRHARQSNRKVRSYIIIVQQPSVWMNQEGTDMLRRKRQYWLLVVMWLSVGSALAAERCPSKPANWACFSEMELQDSTTKTRLFIYSNHELLAEIEQGATTKRYLVVQPSGIELRITQEYCFRGQANIDYYPSTECR
jgi:hypothetical protein